MKNVLLVLLLLLVCGDAQFSSVAHTIPVAWVRYIDMTANGEILALRDRDALLIYSNNGSTFNFKQQFNFGCELCAVDITADGEWMLAVRKSSAFRIYRYDHTHKKYVIHQ